MSECFGSLVVIFHYFLPADESAAWHIHYLRKLTARYTAELLELAQDKDVWRELVVERSDHRPINRFVGLTYSHPTREGEAERCE